VWFISSRLSIFAAPLLISYRIQMKAFSASVLSATFVLAIASSAFCQDFQSAFAKAFVAGDTANQHAILSKWEAEDPSDA